MSDLIVRSLSAVLPHRVAETPVMLLEGPRSVGKSTLLAELTPSSGHPIFDLDQGQFRRLAEQNESALVASESPVLIDEYQRVPSLLDAIKARLNQSSRPGMFVLAGSSSYDSLPQGTQALTGRIQRLTVMPFTQTEIDGTDNRFIERAFESSITHSATPALTERAEYIDRIMRGGMPLAVAAGSTDARSRWLQGHVRQSLERDAGEIRRIHRKADLRHFLNRIAGQTASLLNVSKLAQGLESSRDTAAAYLELLESLFLVSSLPAWGTTISSRSVAAPKIHVVDSGIGAHLLRLSSAKLRRLDPSAMTEFGHLLESFVVQEVIRQTTWMSAPVFVGHWRTRDNDEVDLILERSDGAVIGIEIKAGEQVESHQFSGLRKLRDRLGSSFVAGIAFHLGKVGYQVEDRLHSLPVDRLWR
ncbi:ATP-binding protein [Leucobacter insecticola]|uniref:ATP-binding protein n=1 Tax=Leucobacter insecticola TaxID=2714934 RepID=A0A6G8FIE0_9MICO|nr:ATP-binding protein [Leucobacter insecticola]QIM15812.1 ATP-binding protein [Leucobacter insecticola]